MLTPEEIAEQQQLLATYRRTLAVYLKQQAMLGRAYSPPGLVNGIEEARNNIRRIKRTLNAAGVVVPDDPDDESTTSSLVSPVAVPTKRRSRRLWLWLVAVDIVVLGLVIGGWWWYYGQPTATPSPEVTSPALEEATSPETTPSPETKTQPTLAELEDQLRQANMALSETQVEQVREYINNPNTGYKLLAEHALEVVGDQKFRDTLYLDELDTRYTSLVGQEHYGDFNAERLKEAMMRTWNEHYTDKQVESFEQIVEPRP